MFQSFADKAFRRLFVVILLLFSGSDIILAADLTVEEAGQLALKDDYAAGHQCPQPFHVRAISSRAKTTRPDAQVGLCQPAN